MVMGWGGCALVLNALPSATKAGGDIKRGFNIAGTVIWMWDLVYCVVFIAILICRIVLYPRGFLRMWRKSDGEPLFFGCVAMGIGVVTMGFSPFGPNIMDAAAAHSTAHALFWLAVALCVVAMTVPIWLMITTHSYTFAAMPSSWLLPMVSCVVTSALAGVIGDDMETLHQRLYVNITGYVLWGAGMLPAACTIAVFINRLILHGLPPAHAANSVWILLGPIGQGANAIMMLGRNTGKLQCTGYLCPSGKLLANTCLCQAPLPPNVSLLYDADDPLAFDTEAADQIPLNPLASLGLIAPGLSLFIGFAFWGFGLWLLFLAAATSLSHTYAFNAVTEWIARHTCVPSASHSQGKSMPFNVPWWGMVFPLVTLTMSTYQLSTDTGWKFFEVVGDILGGAVVLFSIIVHGFTLHNACLPAFWAKFHGE